MPASAASPSAPPAQPRSGLLFATLSVAAGSYALLQSLVAPALPDIQRDLHASTTAAAWIFTAYLLSASVVTPIAGRVGDMFGKRKTLVAAIGGLAIGSLISAIATGLPLLIVGRAIQGLGGAVFPLAFGIIRDEFPREKVPSGIALMSAILGIGGGLGIVLSGPILDHLSYHWLFWIPLVIVTLAGAATLLFVPESRQRTPGRINWTGATLLSAWLVCLLLGVSEGPAWGWGDWRTLALFAASAVLAALWVWAEERAEEPLVDMRMMRQRGVWTTNLSTLLIGFGMFASFILVPQLVELPTASGFGFGATVTGAGLFLLPATVAMLLTGPVTGRIATAIGSKLPLVTGALVSSGSFFLLAFAHGQRWEIYVATAVMGIGIGLAFASMANLIVEAVPREQTGIATGMNTIMRSIGSSLGSEISASIIAASMVASTQLPRESGFTAAFATCAVVLLVGTGAALLVPGGGAHAHKPASGAAPSPTPQEG